MGTFGDFEIVEGYSNKRTEVTLKGIIYGTLYEKQ